MLLAMMGLLVGLYRSNEHSDCVLVYKHLSGGKKWVAAI